MEAEVKDSVFMDHWDGGFFAGCHIPNMDCRPPSLSGKRVAGEKNDQGNPAPIRGQLDVADRTAESLVREGRRERPASSGIPQANHEASSQHRGTTPSHGRRTHCRQYEPAVLAGNDVNGPVSGGAERKGSYFRSTASIDHSKPQATLYRIDLHNRAESGIQVRLDSSIACTSAEPRNPRRSGASGLTETPGPSGAPCSHPTGGRSIENQPLFGSGHPLFGSGHPLFGSGHTDRPD